MSMTQKDIENLDTVDITVTQESMDAHIQCLRDNGYKINKPSTLSTSDAFWVTIGIFFGALLTGQVFLG